MRDPNGQIEAINAVVDAFRTNGLMPEKLTYSPLLGPAGNIEFLLGSVAAHATHEPELDVAGVVRKAHETLER